MTFSVPPERPVPEAVAAILLRAAEAVGVLAAGPNLSTRPVMIRIGHGASWAEEG